MNIHKFTDIFTEEELELINQAIAGSPQNTESHLGRIEIPLNLSDFIMNKLSELVKSAYGQDMVVGRGVACIEYSSIHGVPDLPPHFDGDDSELFIDFQLSSNTSWDLGINSEIYSLEDNSAIIFNPNTNIHWRPIKEFKDGEYVKLLFFRGYNSKEKSDYSDKILSQDDPIFKEARDLRDSLAQIKTSPCNGEVS